MFDSQVELNKGDILQTIAGVLTTWAQMHPKGSYGAQCAIMANAIARVKDQHEDALCEAAREGYNEGYMVKYED